MAGKTVTRADLSEAVYQKVGLVADRIGGTGRAGAEGDLRLPRPRRDGEIVLVRLVHGPRKGQRVGRNPKTGHEVPIDRRGG